MNARSLRRARAALFLSVAAFCGMSGGIPAVAHAQGEKANDSPPPPCTEDCWQLAHLTLRGAVNGPMTFELKGTVRANEDRKIPLFGPPTQMRLDDLSMDGASSRPMNGLRLRGR